MPGREIEIRDGTLWYDHQFFPPEESDYWLTYLQEQIEWRQEDIRIFGKTIPQPRLTAWYGEEGKSYTYSGLTWEPLPWTEELQKIRNRIEALNGGLSFNSVLLNLYRDGKDSMGWHADDEPELGENPVIASVSFGAARRFHLKHRHYPKTDRLNLELTHGSLLIMSGSTQHFWLHQIPKTAKITGPRINLTFRYIG